MEIEKFLKKNELKTLEFKRIEEIVGVDDAQVIKALSREELIEPLRDSN